MRTIRLEYPNSTIHVARVSKFGYNPILNKYLIEYYDFQGQIDAFAILEKKGKTYLINPFITSDIYQEFYQSYQVKNIEELPKDIFCIKKHEDINQTKAEAYFLVYRDLNSNKLYVAKTLCDKFQFTNSTIIEGIVYHSVTEEEIKSIEELSHQENINLKPKYKDIYLDNKTIINPKKPNIKLVPINSNPDRFKYYKDNASQKYYVPRQLLEKCRELKLEIEQTPRIIDNKNTYSITFEQLQELIQKTNYKVEEIVIDTNPQEIPQEPKIEQKIEPKKEEEIIIVYRDKRTDKMYIEESYHLSQSTNEKTILNKKCLEITEKECEQIYNKRFIIIDVYLKPDKKVILTVCQTPDKLFIPQEFVQLLEYKDRKKIKVAQFIFIEVTKEEIENIKMILEEDNIEVAIIEKKISKK